MSRIYEEFCELMSAYNEANDKWMPIQKAHELLGSVNEDEIWEQRNAAANALYKYIAELTTRIAELEESDKHWAGNVKVCMQLIERYESDIAELEEQVWNLNLENERLEEAYWIDETISPDGTLKPSVRKLLERLEKAETDLRLSDDLVKALDNRIAKLEAYIDQLIEVGNGMKSFLTPYVDGFRDSYPATSAWESLVKDWKEG